MPEGDTVHEQTVSLDDVMLEDNGYYGLHFDDQSGGDGTGSNSASSLRLMVKNSRITGNNNPAIDPVAADKDGIRVDEGDNYLTTVKMKASGNLDENFKLTQTQDDSASEGGIVARFSRSTVNDSIDGDSIKLESFDNADEGLVGTVFASFQSSEAIGNDSDDIQIEAASGELVIRASNGGETKLSDGVIETIIP